MLTSRYTDGQTSKWADKYRETNKLSDIYLQKDRQAYEKDMEID